MTHARFVRYQSEEWSALYIDGKLDTVGDSYHSDERIAQLLGVEEHGDDDAFMRGGNSYADVAQTLDELDSYVNSRTQLLAQAEALRAQATALEAQASSFREKAGSRA